MLKLLANLQQVDRMARVGEVASSLAHELNQPLTGILGNAQAAQHFLKRETPDLEEVGHILDDIVSDVKRAGLVIQVLRKFLKRDISIFEPFDVNGAIREIIKVIKADLGLKKVTLTTSLASDLPRVRGDQVQLQQVILDLVSNARQAMAGLTPDQRLLVISTSTTVTGEVNVSVRDCGTGISAKKMERLFDPFCLDKPDGIGLGLPICRSIIEAHNGRIWAENNPDGGATIQFTLPRTT